jgi:hypothetical protein
MLSLQNKSSGVFRHPVVAFAPAAPGSQESEVQENPSLQIVLLKEKVHPPVAWLVPLGAQFPVEQVTIVGQLEFSGVLEHPEPGLLN